MLNPFGILKCSDALCDSLEYSFSHFVTLFCGILEQSFKFCVTLDWCYKRGVLIVCHHYANPMHRGPYSSVCHATD